MYVEVFYRQLIDVEGPSTLTTIPEQVILGYINKTTAREQAASLTKQSLPPLLPFLFDFPQWGMMTQDQKEAEHRAHVSSLFTAHEEARILITDH